MAGFGDNYGRAILGEFLGTFLLVTTVLHVATTKALARNIVQGAPNTPLVIIGQGVGGLFVP